MPSRSAGLVVYRRAGHPLDRHPAGDYAGDYAGGTQGQLEVLLVHPGGPYWARRDEGWWSIPKGEVGEGEDELTAAEREFAEELGLPAPAGARIALGEVVQAGGKHVRAWAVSGDLDVSAVSGDTFELEWPPRSGRVQTFPEVDRAGWFGLEAARVKLLAGQLPLLDRLELAVAATQSPDLTGSGPAVQGAAKVRGAANPAGTAKVRGAANPAGTARRAPRAQPQ